MKSSLTVLFGFLFFCVDVVIAQEDPLIVELRYNPGSADKPFELNWNAIPGQRYEILVTSDLETSPWTPLTPEPITATSQSEIFFDTEILSPRFYVIRQLADNPDPGTFVPVLTPSHAALATGQTQRFTVELPPGETAIWSVKTLAGGDAGSISATGVYTAPATVPEPSFVVLQVQGTKNPKLRALGLITIMPQSELIITREQAAQILLLQVIPTLTNPANAVGLGLQEPLSASDELRPAKMNLSGSITGAGAGNVQIPSNSWFFMVDPTPEKAWAHLVRYVFINAQTGEVTTQFQEWHPLLNGYPIWVRMEHRKSSPDLVYLGSEFKAAADRDSLPTPAALAAASEGALTQPRWDSIFAHIPTECDCAQVMRYALVIADDSPSSESNPFASAANWLTGVFDQDAEERILHGGQLMAETLEAAGFQVTRLLGANNTGRAQINNELVKMRAKVKPCDIFVLYHTGHGNKEGIGRHIYGFYERFLKWFHTPSKYIIIDSCYAGNIIKALDDPKTVQAVILTSSDAATASNVLYDADNFDTVKGRRPLAFTNGLLTCGASSSSMGQVHTCGIALDEEIEDPNPLLRVVGTGLDADGDGVVDSIERGIGVDPAVPDTDADGACDGLELAALTLKNNATALNYEKPVISADPLPSAGVLQAYSTAIELVKPGQIYNATAASPSNPHGFGPNNGWVILTGSLPGGFALDRMTGRISGTTAQGGVYPFTIRYSDAIGVSTTQEMSLQVILQPNTESPVIQATTELDGNVRDNDISLREAILLASGELSVAVLRPDPDPNDGISEGEVRWVRNGVPGASSADTIEYTRAGTTILNSALVINGSNDTLDIRVEVVVRSTGPSMFIVNGDANHFDMSGTFEANGSVLEIRGNNNRIGFSRLPGARSFSRLNGANKGDGVVVTGNNNWIGGVFMRGFENAAVILSTNNTLTGARFSGNVNGVVLGPGAFGNLISSCAIGYVHEDTDPEPGGNTGHGVWMHGGARNNKVLDCGIGGNDGSGLMITGSATQGNQILKGRVGSTQGFAQRSALVGPNGNHGIVIQNGASYNRITGTEINDNTGHGILLTGAGTAFNDLGSGDNNGILIVQTNGLGSGIRIEGGSVSNLLSIRVQQCASDAISIHGIGTDGNEITTRDASNVRWPTEILKTKGAAIRISGGARKNLLNLVRVNDCELGIVIQDPGTEENLIVSATGNRNVGPVILLTGGCRYNRIETPGSMGQNKSSGIVISGVGTSFNQILGANLSPLQPNDKYAIEISDGASLNSISESSISGHKLGGIRITGVNTVSNQVLQTTVNGGFLEDAIASSGFGLVLDGGAQHNQITDCYFYGNGLSGISIAGSETAYNKVAGSRFEGNRRSGILIENARQNILGQPGQSGNIFLRAVEAAIRISGVSASSNRVVGNIIGASGISANLSHGILIDSGAHHNRIGGSRSRQPKFETIPQVFVPLREMDRAHGNLISGNGGDGIRIEGAHSNVIAGNLVGFSDNNRIAPGNGGNGIAILNGSVGNCIGNCEAKPKYSNQINNNSGAGVLVSGATTERNSIMRNSIFDNPGGYIVLREGANNNRPIPSVGIDAVAARISGTADVAGYVEVFSTFIDDPGIFHLRAFVQKGEYMIDQLKPELSINAVLIESPRPLRLGDQFLSFTSAVTGDTSEFYTFSSDP